MTAYILAKLIHVLVAVVGLGSITATGVLATSARDAPPPGIVRLTWWATASIVLVFASGVALDLLAGGAFHVTQWFRVAGLSLIVTAVVVGRTRAAARRWVSGALSHEVARRRVARSSWIAAVLVAWIVVLMELRPFA